jgi:5'-nucleotidase
MNILLTNDDGIHFPGIQALYDVFSIHFNVFIFAPAMEKSATSQAMTLYEDIYVKQLEKNIFIVNGYPVDCINIALHSGLISEKFDLVISGINKGVNMGEDIFYSGTVGAARHAYIHNIPSIAISSGFLDNTGDFRKVAVFLKKLVDNEDFTLSQPFLWNINYPDKIKMPEIIKWTKSGTRIYRDKYKKTLLNKNEFLFNLGGSELGNKEIGGTDFEAYSNGFVSITPLNKDGTDHNYNPKSDQR